MTRPLRLAAVSGGLQRPSKSAALAEHLLDLIADEIPCEQRLVDLGQLAPKFAGTVWRSQLPDAVERAYQWKSDRGLAIAKTAIVSIEIV